MTAAERAETYLRLMAEGELRRALAYPRYEPPEPSGLPPAVRSAVHLSRPVFAPLLPPLRSAARLSGPLLASFWPTARTAVSAARRTPAGRAAEPVLWRTLHVRQAIRAPRPSRGRFADSPAGAGLDRVRRVASALVAADAISEPTAQTVIESLTDALTVRGKLTVSRLHRPPSPRWWGPGSPWRPGSPPPPLPAGPVQAVPIAATLPQGPGGDLGGAALLALVLAPDRAVLTAAGHSSQPGRNPGRPGRRLPPPLSSGQLTAVDDRGTRYQADADHRPVYDRWSLGVGLTPVPPPGTRWLDITGDDAHAPVRVDLTRAASPGVPPGPHRAGPDPIEPGRDDWASLASRVSPAERPLHTLAERLLAEATHGHENHDAPPLADLTEMVGALQAGAGLETGSAALGRLATLAGRLGTGFPAALRPLAQPTALPEAWLSVLEHRGATDGPDRVAAGAAVLPEVDGARFAVAGLDSAADSATLRVVAWGWQPSPLTGLGDRFSWWARDDQGRWHLARGDGARFGGGQVDLFVEFGPALHPDARSLQLFVRGPTAQVAVSLPLRWLEPR